MLSKFPVRPRSAQSFLRMSILAMLMQSSCVAAAGAGPPAGWIVSITGANAWQGNSSLGENGGFRVNRSVLDINANRLVGSRLFAGFSLGYEEDRYSFSGTSPDPLWSNIRYLQVGLSLRLKANEQWSVFGFPVQRYSVEEGASFSDGQETGLLAGATYRVSDSLTIGPGFGYSSGIGEKSDLFPILLINWKITETLTLETGRGLAASRGPGLALKWRPDTAWEFGLAARYEKSRFRLDSDERRIGQDKSIPIVATASWKFDRKLTLSALAGIETSGELSLENSDGRRLQKLNYDSAPLYGVVAKIRF